MNFGILIAWIALSCMTIPLFQWYVRRKQVREWERSNHQRNTAYESDSQADTMQG